MASLTLFIHYKEYLVDYPSFCLPNTVAFPTLKLKLFKKVINKKYDALDPIHCSCCSFSMLILLMEN